MDLTIDSDHQTAHGRLEVLKQVATRFSKHLENVPGAFLSDAQRLFVAKEARRALYCKGCAALINNKACFMPKTVYQSIANIPHNDLDDKEYEGIVNEKQVTCLRNIVRAIINWQSALNVHWYCDAIKDLEESGIVSRISDCDDAEVSKAPCYTAFAEIVTLTSVSHGLYVAFLALDVEIPALPERISPGGPTKIDFRSLLKSSLHFDNNFLAAAPILLLKDINKSSPELAKLEKSTVLNLHDLIGDKMFPAIGIYIALDDYAIFKSDFITNCYLKPSFVSGYSYNL